MTSIKGYVYILSATLFWGISATVAKFLFTQQMNTLVLVQMRISLSCIILFTIFIFFRRDLLHIKVRDLYSFALLGILGMAGSNFTYYFAIEQTNVSTAILLQYMAPLVVLIYAAISGDEKLTYVKVIAGIVSLGGCILAVLGKDFSLLKMSKLGLLAGIASAICWSFTNIWLRRVLKEYSIWTALIYAFIFASVFWLFFNPPWEIVAAQYSSQQWMIFTVFALISILIPHAFYFAGGRHLTTSHTVITATSEPVIAILSAYVFLQEVLVPLQLVGAVLVVSAIALLQIKEKVQREEIP